MTWLIILSGVSVAIVFGIWMLQINSILKNNQTQALENNAEPSALSRLGANASEAFGSIKSTTGNFFQSIQGLFAQTNEVIIESQGEQE